MFFAKLPNGGGKIDGKRPRYTTASVPLPVNCMANIEAWELGIGPNRLESQNKVLKATINNVINVNGSGTFTRPGVTKRVTTSDSSGS